MNLKTRQFLFIKKFKESIKSIFEWVVFRLLRFLKVVKKKIRFYLKSPFKSISDLWKPILFLGFCSIFAYCVFTDDIYIEDTEIQGSAKDLGFTGEMITQQALAIIPDVVKQRVENLPTHFLQIYQRSSDQFEDDQMCNANFLLGKIELEFFLHNLTNVEMSSETPDQFVTSQSISIKKLAYWVRKKIGIAPVRVLKPVLWKEGNRFLFKLTPTPILSEGTAQTFEKIEDTPRIMASELINFLSPDLLGVELISSGLMEQKYFHFPLDVANKFLNDEQQVFRILNMQVAGQLDFSKSQADLKYKYIGWEEVNKLLLEKLDFSHYGVFEIINKALLTGRIVRAECYKAGKKCNKDIYANLHKQYIGKYLDDLEKTIPGQRLLLMYDIQLGNMDLFHTHLKHFLEKNQSHFYDEPVSTFDFISFLIELLIEVKQYDEANKLANSKAINSYDLNQLPAQSTIVFRSLRSILKLHNGDLSEYQQLVTEDFNNYPCAEWLTSFRVHEMWRMDEKTRNKMPALIRTISDSFGQLERSGLKSSAFYNTWGIIEDEAGNYKSAFKKYDQALKFEGDHSWILLNWGVAALNDGNFDLARDKYQKSLEFGLVPNAAHGLLRALWGQGDSKAYLENFEKYSEAIKDAYEYPVRSEFERAAITFSCGLEGSIKSSVLDPKDGILIEGKIIPREEFKKMTCTTRPN